jgi:hypothetical protein
VRARPLHMLAAAEFEAACSSVYYTHYTPKEALIRSAQQQRSDDNERMITAKCDILLHMCEL